MVILSKQLFDEHINSSVRCCDILHKKENSCTKALFTLLFGKNSFILGVSKFFLPIYLVKMIIEKKKNKMSKNYWIYTIKSFIRSILYGSAFGSLVLTSNCAMRNLTGRFHYYNVGFIAGVISGSSIFIESITNRKLDTLIFFNSVIEAGLNNLQHSKIVNFTKLKQTALFMLISALIMHSSKDVGIEQISPSFWFYLPKIKNSTEKCYHEGEEEINCETYSYKGFLKYFAVGYAINIVKSLLATMGKLVSKPSQIINVLFKKSNVQFGLFLGGYVGLFRLLNCYLFRYHKEKLGSLIQLMAGLISGTTFLIKPSLNMITIGITTLLQILYFKLSNKYKQAKQLPLKEILFMISNGILLHHRIVRLDVCPSYYVKVTDIATNGLAKQIYSQFLSKYFS